MTHLLKHIQCDYLRVRLFMPSLKNPIVLVVLVFWSQIMISLVSTERRLGEEQFPGPPQLYVHQCWWTHQRPLGHSGLPQRGARYFGAHLSISTDTTCTIFQGTPTSLFSLGNVINILVLDRVCALLQCCCCWWRWWWCRDAALVASAVSASPFTLDPFPILHLVPTVHSLVYFASLSLCTSNLVSSNACHFLCLLLSFAITVMSILWTSHPAGFRALNGNQAVLC